MIYKRLAGATLAGALALAGAAFVAPQSQAAGPSACPAAFPTAQAVDGVKGTGYTVDKGTTPSPFKAEVLGRITDGIAPGVDMIMAEVHSPVIDKPGVGVWAGMSGSPVYAADGRLIGAVAYGLSFAPTPIAGITPASEMRKLLTAPGAAAMKGKVAVSSAVAKRLAATGKVTAAQAASGFQRLKLPLGVSGLSSLNADDAKKFSDRLQAKLPDVRVLSSGSAAAGGSTASEIVPGGNFVAALSYGDATFAGTGTTTFVCGNKAVAFGHPFDFTGAANMSVHPANAVLIQPDPVFGSFKVANPGGVVGKLDQDRQAGVRATLGATPATAAITSTVTVPGRGSRVGRTTLVDQRFGADIAAFHTLFNLDKMLDGDRVGTAAMTITVKGVKTNGTAFTLVRKDQVGSDSISFAGADAVFALLFRLTDQKFEKVRLTSVDVKATVKVNEKPLTVLAVDAKQGTKYVPIPQNGGSSLKAKAGGTLPLRIKLAPYQSGGTPLTTVNLSLAIPKGTKGQFGDGSLTGGGMSFSPDESEPTSFAQLLKDLATEPSGNSVNASLNILLDGGKQLSSSAKATLKLPVQGFGRFFSVEIT